MMDRKWGRHSPVKSALAVASSEPAVIPDNFVVVMKFFKYESKQYLHSFIHLLTFRSRAERKDYKDGYSTKSVCRRF